MRSFDNPDTLPLFCVIYLFACLYFVFYSQVWMEGLCQYSACLIYRNWCWNGATCISTSQSTSPPLYRCTCSPSYTGKLYQLVIFVLFPWQYCVAHPTQSQIRCFIDCNFIAFHTDEVVGKGIPANHV